MQRGGAKPITMPSANGFRIYLFAYRLADAVGRPYAATASGGDWAYIKEAHLPGLVRGWIGLSYAAGHGLMAPVCQ
jgi:hypothetical protein